MKLTRKLIPAMIMLLVSAVLMSTASFAWFAMNTTVTATGMAVKAKADSIFLEITGGQDKDGQTDEWGTTGTDMVVDAETGKVTAPVELYPVAHNTFSKGSDVAEAKNWYYKYATDPESSASTSAETPLGALTGYVYHTTFKVRLNPNLVTEAVNLRVNSVSLPKDTGISLVLACGDTVLTDFKTDYAAAEGVTDQQVLLAAMGKAEVTIDVYIYIDGAHEKVYTNNASALVGEVSFTLAVSAKPAQQQG